MLTRLRRFLAWAFSSSERHAVLWCATNYRAPDGLVHAPGITVPGLSTHSGSIWRRSTFGTRCGLDMKVVRLRYTDKEVTCLTCITRA